jgi:2-methylcitrate dehydratase PrpD
VLSRSVSETLVRRVSDGLPDVVRAETVRSLLNVVGTSIAASHSETVDVIVGVATQHEGTGSARVPGRDESLDPLNAALATGTAAHLDDFDDTHLETVVHPAAAVFAAGLALASSYDVAGVTFLDAMALGMEIQLRLALAMTPWHYDQGWHITGTVGSVGAAVTAAHLMGLDATATSAAMGLASSLPLGHREGFGTMVKPLHPGKAAANGLLAAALARRGVAAAPDALEAPNGYFAMLSPHVELSRVADRLGDRWELLENTYKPYPCGIVSHPAIEAAERLHPQVAGREIVGVTVHCHPLVVELTGNPTPGDGLSARFSTIHGVAVGLLDGTVGLEQYAEARVGATDVAGLRARVALSPSPDIPRDSAAVEVVLDTGEHLRADIDHVRGSLARPLTDAQLDEKVRRLISARFPEGAARIIEVTRALPGLSGLGEFLTAIVTGR